MIRSLFLLILLSVFNPCDAQHKEWNASWIQYRLEDINASNLDSLATRRAVEQLADECQKMNQKAYAMIPGMFSDPTFSCALCRQNIKRIELGTACIYDVREQEIVHYFNELMSGFNALNVEIQNSAFILKDELNKPSNWRMEVVKTSDTLRLALHHQLIDSMFAHFDDSITVSMQYATKGVQFFETKLTYRQLSTNGIFCLMDAAVCEGKMNISLDLSSIPDTIAWGWCDCEGKRIHAILPFRID